MAIMHDKPRHYLNRLQSAGRKKYVRNASRSSRIVPTGTAAEVGRELRNLIRVVDTKIIGATKNWDDMLKKYLVQARLSIGKTPREEAEALSDLIAAAGLHIVSTDRWEFKMFSKELIPAIQSSRIVLGQEVDGRFEDIQGILP